MEEEKYTAYDLEKPEVRDQMTEGSDISEGMGNSENLEKSEVRDQKSDLSEISEIPENSERTGNSKISEDSEHPEISDSLDMSPAEAEIERMVKEMGADALLGIIRDNRNIAIEQIISEMQSAAKPPLPSGVSAVDPCSSIFDLAALA